MSPAMNKTDILALTQLKVEEVHIDSINGTVRLKELDGAARAKFLGILQTHTELDADDPTDKSKAKIDITGVIVPMVAMSVVDQDDTPMFTEAEVAKLNGRFVQDVFEAAQELNGMSAMAVERAEGN